MMSFLLSLVILISVAVSIACNNSRCDIECNGALTDNICANNDVICGSNVTECNIKCVNTGCDNKILKSNALVTTLDCGYFNDCQDNITLTCSPNNNNNYSICVFQCSERLSCGKDGSYNLNCNDNIDTCHFDLKSNFDHEISTININCNSNDCECLNCESTVNTLNIFNIFNRTDAPTSFPTEYTSGPTTSDIIIDERTNNDDTASGIVLRDVQQNPYFYLALVIIGLLLCLCMIICLIMIFFYHCICIETAKIDKKEKESQKEHEKKIKSLKDQRNKIMSSSNNKPKHIRESIDGGITTTPTNTANIQNIIQPFNQTNNVNSKSTANNVNIREYKDGDPSSTTNIDLRALQQSKSEIEGNWMIGAMHGVGIKKAEESKQYKLTVSSQNGSNNKAIINASKTSPPPPPAGSPPTTYRRQRNIDNNIIPLPVAKYGDSLDIGNLTSSSSNLSINSSSYTADSSQTGSIDNVTSPHDTTDDGISDNNDSVSESDSETHNNDNHTLNKYGSDTFLSNTTYEKLKNEHNDYVRNQFLNNNNVNNYTNIQRGNSDEQILASKIYQNYSKPNHNPNELLQSITYSQNNVGRHL